MAGQTACVPCPAAGVDCAQQDRVEVLPGWYRALDSASSDPSTASALAPSGELELHFSIAGDLTDTTHATIEAGLRRHLQCADPVCTVGLQLTAGSVHVVAAVNDSAAASVTAAVALTRLTDDALAERLGFDVEGDVKITRGSAAAAGLLEDGLRPVRCPERESCLGGHNSSCAAGHTGALCGTCAAGYFKSGGVCTECDRDAGPSIALYVGGAALTLIVAFVYLLVQLNGGEDRATTGKEPSARRSSLARWVARRANGPFGTMLAQLRRRSKNLGTIGKILLAYFQVLNAFSQLPSVRWPERFAAFLESLSVFSFELFSVSPLGCRLDMEVSFAHELVATLLLPLGGALVVLVLAQIAAACQLPREERRLIEVAVRPETITLQLWVMLLLYPSVAKTALGPFDCVSLGERSLLRVDPSVACDDGAWYVLAVLGGFGTAVYSLGFPLLCFLVTRDAHRAQSDAAQTDDQEDEASVGDASLSDGNLRKSNVLSERRFARAKLLLRSYMDEFWYWESLDILRKYLLTSVVMVVRSGMREQVYLGQLVCTAFVILLANRQPYASKLCGRVQLLALTQLSFTYLSGWLFFDDGSSDTISPESEDVWGVVLVIVNGLVFVVLAFGLCGASYGAARDAQAELEKRRAAEARLRAEIEAMRRMLEEPTQRETAMSQVEGGGSSSSRRQSEVLKRARIAMDELNLDKKLGAGMFGEVYTARYNGTPVAVKTMHAHHLSAEAHVAAFRDEVLLLLELRHPNIVQLIGGSWDVGSGEMCLVLELCSGGSLAALLEDSVRPLTWERELLPIAIGTARGMAHLHAQSPPIVHRDLKPANVLLGEGLAPKIGDMGTALEMEDGAEEQVANAGSPLFQAPEVLRREQADHRCDVWSYGCVCCCLSARSDNPYHPTPPSNAVELVALLRLRPSVSHAASPLDMLIARATELEYEDRPPMVELLPELEGGAMLERARALDAEAERKARRLITRQPMGRLATEAQMQMMTQPRPLPSCRSRGALSAAEAAAPLTEASLVFGSESEQRREAMLHSKSSGKKSAPGRKTERGTATGAAPRASPRAISTKQDENELAA